jgi:hypothetical protein
VVQVHLLPHVVDLFDCDHSIKGFISRRDPIIAPLTWSNGSMDDTRDERPPTPVIRPAQWPPRTMGNVDRTKTWFRPICDPQLQAHLTDAEPRSTVGVLRIVRRGDRGIRAPDLAPELERRAPTALDCGEHFCADKIKCAQRSTRRRRPQPLLGRLPWSGSYQKHHLSLLPRFMPRKPNEKHDCGRNAQNRLARQAVEAAYVHRSIGTVTVCPPAYPSWPLPPASPSCASPLRTTTIDEYLCGTSARTSSNRLQHSLNFRWKRCGDMTSLKKLLPVLPPPINRFFVVTFVSRLHRMHPREFTDHHHYMVFRIRLMFRDCANLAQIPPRRYHTATRTTCSLPSSIRATRHGPERKNRSTNSEIGIAGRNRRDRDLQHARRGSSMVIAIDYCSSNHKAIRLVGYSSRLATDLGPSFRSGRGD